LTELSVIARREAKAFPRLGNKEFGMNWDVVAGQWKELQGKFKEQWGKLTDDDLNIIAGKRDQLSGILQQRYGRKKEEVEQEIATWEKEYDRLLRS
jgi:uncharacterized protein YjbJ (UPF0337 family)